MAPGKVPESADRGLEGQTPTRPPLPHRTLHLLPQGPASLQPGHAASAVQAPDNLSPQRPHPSSPPEDYQCGRECTSSHILLDCPRFNDARNGLLPATTSQNFRFEPIHLPRLVTFLRRTGPGFSRDLRDKTRDTELEVEDLDVGLIGDMALDLDL